MRRLLSAVLPVLLLALAACGGDDDGDVTAGDDTTTTETADDTTTTTTTTTVAEEPDGTTTTTADPGPLPGERVEIFPYEGAQLIVVGVEAGDRLNVRVRPGVEAGVAFDLAPLADGLVATGHNRRLEGSGQWSEITAAGRTGWANSAYLSHRGQTNDVTSEVVTGERPRASTIRELGLAVARQRASQEPPSDIVVVARPTVGDLAEVTVDVLGSGDDSVAGERLHVFGEPVAGGVVLRTVEATVLCLRGVTDDGLCL
jgi:hypothetical protein